MDSGINAAHHRALAIAQSVLDQVRPDQLDLPTPCADWTLRRLLAHVIGQNRGFAQAALGHGADLARWADQEVGADPAAEFAASADALRAAFGRALEHGDTLLVPQILAGHPFPVEQAIGFQVVDTLIHAWDVAAAIDTPLTCPDDLAELLLRLARQVPATPDARAPGRAFAPVLDSAGPSAFDQALALLGRDPGWSATHR